MDEFDMYFQRAKLDEDLGPMQQASFSAGGTNNNGPTARRGSVPNITLQPAEPNFHHKRTLSCRTPTRRRGNVSPRGARSPSRRSHGGSHSLLAESPVPEEMDENPNPLLTPPFEGNMPVSRSGSFRKRNPRIDKELQELQVTPHNELNRSRRNSVQQEEIEATLKMEKLRLLEQEDLCVVRSFSTSSRGIVNRGDSVKRKRHKPPRDNHTQGDDHMESVAERDIHNGRDANSSSSSPMHTSSQGGGSGGGTVPARSSGGDAHRVYIIGDQSVGKSALINQFLTSEYMGAATDGVMDDKLAHTVSVEIDGEETMMDLVEVKPSKIGEGGDFPDLDGADALVFVYALDEHRSFNYVQDVLQEVRRQDSHNGAVIMVANKSDLVRSRDVTEDEAIELCRQYDSKFIEVSCAINHKVDDMLVGIVTQIRLNRKRRKVQKPRRNPDGTRVVTCLSSARVMLRKMFGPKKEVTHECDNLLVL